MISSPQCGLTCLLFYSEVTAVLQKFKDVYVGKANSQGKAGVPLVQGTGSGEAWDAFNHVFGNEFKRIFADADLTAKFAQPWAFGMTKDHRHYGVDTYGMGPQLSLSLDSDSSWEVAACCWINSYRLQQWFAEETSDSEVLSSDTNSESCLDNL